MEIYDHTQRRKIEQKTGVHIVQDESHCHAVGRMIFVDYTRYLAFLQLWQYQVVTEKSQRVRRTEKEQNAAQMVCFTAKGT